MLVFIKLRPFPNLKVAFSFSLDKHYGVIKHDSILLSTFITGKMHVNDIGIGFYNKFIRIDQNQSK